MSAAKKRPKDMDEAEAELDVSANLKNKDYERELARLHVELVKLCSVIGDI